MGANFLTFCDFEEQDFNLIAVHTVLQDYKLAYLLNAHVGFQLNRIVPDLDYVIKGQKAFFSAFEYEDDKNLSTIHLIENKFKIKSTTAKNTGLFYAETLFDSSYVYLQPEVKKADFLLKVQDEYLELKTKQILNQINTIGGVVTSYLVDKQKLNHKEYLIF